MRWWCSAVGVPWSWVWRPYAGVWLLLLAASVLYLARAKRSRTNNGLQATTRPGLFFAGLFLVWAALDWPIGTLAGYLASLHMTQFLLLTMAAPPLLLLGWPRAPAAPAGPLRRLLHQPVLTLIVFSAIVVLTHLPVVTDGLMPSQPGSFAIDLGWLGGGLLFWSPLLSRDAPAWFGPPVRMTYLFADMVLMTAPGAMITFSDLPIYATYELAPPIPGINPIDDQRLAGLIMRLGVALVSWLAISIMFLRWNRAEERLMEEEARALGAESARAVPGGDN